VIFPKLVSRRLTVVIVLSALIALTGCGAESTTGASIDNSVNDNSPNVVPTANYTALAQTQYSAGESVILNVTGSDSDGTIDNIIWNHDSVNSVGNLQFETSDRCSFSGVGISSNATCELRFTAPEVGVQTTLYLSAEVEDNDGGVRFARAFGDNSDSKSKTFLEITILPYTLSFGNEDATAPVAQPRNYLEDLQVIAGDTIQIGTRAYHDPSSVLNSVVWSQQGYDSGSDLYSVYNSVTHAPAKVINLTNRNTTTPAFVAPSTDGVSQVEYFFKMTSAVISGAEAVRDVYQKVTVVNQNSSPIANIVAPSQAVEGSLVSLNGIGSYDPDSNDTLTYQWAVANPAQAALITLNNATSSVADFTAPDVAVATVIPFNLTVTDNHGAVSTVASVPITITPVNNPPTVDAGSNQVVSSGATVTLTATAADTDGSIASYAWTIPADWTDSDSGTNTLANMTAPTVSEPTNYEFVIQVTDNEGAVASDRVVVSVQPPNQAPVARAGSDLTVSEGATVFVSAASSYDPENTALTYAWTEIGTTDLTLNNNTSSVANFAAPSVSSLQVYRVGLVVTDAAGLASATDEVLITVEPISKTPVISLGANESVISDPATANLVLNVTIQDADQASGHTIVWNAPAGQTDQDADTTNAAFEFDVPDNLMATTDYEFVVLVTDADNNSVTDSVTVTVNVGDQKPIAITGNDQTVSEGDTVFLSGVQSYDPEGTAITYAWTEIGSSDLTINNNTTSVANFTAPAVVSQRAYTLGLVVTDASGNASIQDTMQVNIEPISNAPVITLGSNQSVLSDAATTNVTLSVSIQDADQVSGHTIAWFAPAGVTDQDGNTTNANFEFDVPDSLSETRNFEFIVQVTDSDSNTVTDSVIVTVNVGNQRPVAEAGSHQEVAEGATVYLSGVSSSDPENAALTFAWTEIGSSDLTINNSTASVANFVAPTVTSRQVYTLGLIVTDGSMTSVQDTVQVGINPISQAPVISLGTNESVDASATTANLSLTVDIDDADQASGHTIVWYAPSGVSDQDADTTNATFVFDVPDSLVSTQYYEFVVKVTDADGNAVTDNVTVTVNVGDRIPVAVTGSDQSVPEGSTVFLNGVSSYDHEGTAITYAWTEIGTTDLTINSNTASVANFTAPTVANTRVYTIGLVVTDAGGNASVQDTVQITIEPVNLPPIVTAGSNQSVSAGFSTTVTAVFSDPDGDVTTVAWKVPNGLLLTGGTTESDASITFSAPSETTEQVLVFEVTATDAYGATASDTVSIAVAADTSAHLRPVAEAGDNQTVEDGTTVYLNGGSSYDPENTALTYAWVEIGTSDLTLNNAATSLANFTAPSLSNRRTYIIGLTVTDSDANPLSSIQDTVQIVVEPNNFNNYAPVVTGGIAQSLSVAADGNTRFFSLVASPELPPGVSVSTHLWNIESGGGTLTGANSASATYESLPKSDGQNAATADTLRITTTFSDGSNATERVYLYTNASNDANGIHPISDAGNHQYVVGGDTVTLDASGSSADIANGRSISSYQWSQIAGKSVVLNNANTASPTFEAPALPEDGLLQFSLSVTDDVGQISSDEVTITVRAQ